MSDLVEFFTSQEIIVVYFVVIAASVLCFMIYLVEKNNVRARRRHNTRELNKLVKEVREQTVEEEPVETVFYEEPVLLQSVEVEPKESSVEELLQEVNTPEVLEETAPEVVPNNYQVSFDYLEEDTLEDVFDDIEPVVVESAPVVEPVVETMDEVSSNDDELVYTDIEPDVETAQRQLQELTEELQRQEEQKKAENIKLTSYEEQQEESAIISLEELIQKSKSMYEANELTQYVDEGNVPISLQELESRKGVSVEENLYDEPFIIENVVPVEELEETSEVTPIVVSNSDETHEPVVIEQPTEVKKFKSSPIISPIFGIEKEPMSEQELALENTANYQKFDDEIRKTNEFLMTLKELQQKLDS